MDSHLKIGGINGQSLENMLTVHLTFNRHLTKGTKLVNSLFSNPFYLCMLMSKGCKESNASLKIMF